MEVKGERATSPVGRQSLRGSEIQRIPGATGDALRALQALPSIGVANDFSGALYIRGGSDEDNLYYFDRVPIGYPYHFGGIVSSLSSEIIERIDCLRRRLRCRIWCRFSSGNRHLFPEQKH